MREIRVGDAAEARAEWRRRRLGAPQFHARIVDAAAAEESLPAQLVFGIEPEPHAQVARRVYGELDDGGARRARPGPAASVADVLASAGWG